MSFDWTSYRQALAKSNAEVEWADGSDLSRLSIDAAVGANSIVRRDVSHGHLRLTGDGVDGHSAFFDEIANAMRAFQRLVTASGMALTGHRALKGPVPADIASKTRLSLSGSAQPGSLVLPIVPAMSPADELQPSGQAEFFTEESMLVDRAVGHAVELLHLGAALEADADSGTLLKQVKDDGPRVASALRDFSKKMAEANFTSDIVWEQPRRRRLRSVMTAAQHKHLGGVIDSRSLEDESVTLEGILRTVSDISALRVEVAEGDIVAFGVNDLPADQIRTLRVGDRVRVEGTQFEATRPGGDVRIEYTAQKVSRLQ